MDPSVHPVITQAVSGQEQRGWKASSVRVERRVPNASPCPYWNLGALALVWTNKAEDILEKWPAPEPR